MNESCNNALPFNFTFFTDVVLQLAQRKVGPKSQVLKIVSLFLSLTEQINIELFAIVEFLLFNYCNDSSSLESSHLSKQLSMENTDPTCFKDSCKSSKVKSKPIGISSATSRFLFEKNSFPLRRLPL